MFEKQRLCGDGACTTRAQEFRDGDKKVDGEEEQFAHGVNGTTPANACKIARFMWIGSYCEFAIDNPGMDALLKVADPAMYKAKQSGNSSSFGTVGV